MHVIVKLREEKVGENVFLLKCNCFYTKICINNIYKIVQEKEEMKIWYTLNSGILIRREME